MLHGSQSYEGHLEEAVASLEDRLMYYNRVHRSSADLDQKARTMKLLHCHHDSQHQRRNYHDGLNRLWSFFKHGR
jgi:hypothetical protein